MIEAPGVADVFTSVAMPFAVSVLGGWYVGYRILVPNGARDGARLGARLGVLAVVMNLLAVSAGVAISGDPGWSMSMTAILIGHTLTGVASSFVVGAILAVREARSLHSKEDVE